MNLVQLVPGAPPLVNGVADFALTVARALRRDQGIESTFVVCNPAWTGPAEIDGFRLYALRSRRAEDLRASLLRLAGGTAAILLQLSPYGFDSNGSPFWLARGLADWKRAAAPAAPRLLTYFHELYATSVPWRRGFWRSPIQRFCARQVLRLSDVAMTNTQRYAARLAQWDRDRADAIRSLAVVSGIGEPADVVPLDRRPRQLVVWGGALARRDTYRVHGRTLEAALRAAGVDQVLDVGPPCADTPARIGRATVRRMGVMPPDQLSAALTGSILGAMAYNPNFLGKSSLFAAFCAHGVPALVLPTHPLEKPLWDGIHPGEHFLTAAFADAGDASAFVEMKRVAGRARTWYEAHDAATHARAIAEILVRMK